MMDILVILEVGVKVLMKQDFWFLDGVFNMFILCE